MSNYNDIIQEINTNLPDNDEQLITAEKLRTTLIDFVNEVDYNEDNIETSIQGKQDTLIFDNTPTENSDNPVTSDGIYDSLQEKADKVSNATNGNFAGLNSNGNLTDSGYNTLSFPNLLRVSNITQLTSEQCDSLHIGDIVAADYVSYLVTTLDETDIDLSYADSDTITTVIYSRDDTSEPWQYINTTRYSLSTKPNKPSSFTIGHLAALDSQANLTDSGKAVSDFATAAQGALADTAYQKPLTGIPASDLADGVIPLPEIFVAIVNRTTYQEIADALADGKVLIAVDGNKTYYYAGLSPYNSYMFFSLLEQSYFYIGVNSFNLWSISIMSGIESTSNKVTSISSSSTNTEYPSAKCVYDALQEKTNKVSNATNGNFAGLDSNGNITDSGSNASDFATAAQGALADTAYQKPSTGIPASDLASGVIPQPEVFFAEYGVTTNSEIENAVINGKVIVCVYNYRLYVYGTYYTVGYNTKHCFYCWVNNKCYQISLAVSTDAWTDDGYIEIPDISGKADKTSVVTLTGTSVTQELADNTIYQCSELSSLTITVPSGITSDYISQINFESGSTATTLTAPNTIIWFGDDLTNNVFVPAIGKQYVVIFYYDGTNVRSIVQSE